MKGKILTLVKNKMYEREIINHVTILLLLAIGMAACANTPDDLWGEISPDSKSQVIEKEIDGIAFKFCLLNEQRKPTANFIEGENIIFSFSLKNNLKESISIPTYFINDDFYRIYENNNTDMGKAWTGIWCEFRYENMMIELLPYEQKELNCPWRLSEIFQADYPLCKGDDMNPLPQGEYLTSLRFDLFYIVEGKQKCIKNAIFKINFRIQ